MVESALTRPGQRERYDVKFLSIDWVLVALLTLITGIGILILYSVSGMSWHPWAYKQLVTYMILFAVMIGMAMMDLRWWLAIAYPFYGLSLFLLALVPVIGHSHMGARRWLELGHFGFQPSEMMKLAIVLALARWYHQCIAKEANFHWKLIVPFALVGIPVALVMKQPDLGTAILIGFTGLSVMALAGLNWKRLLAIGAAIGGAIPFLKKLLKPYQYDRLTTFLHPDNDPSGTGYHIIQSKIAIGSGGLLGKGLGLGSQSQLNFLPEKHTDFILAAVGEELGLAGAIAVVFLYSTVVFMALRIATISHSHFGRLAAAGATTVFAAHILINGAMVMGMAPVVGVPMPLLSYGGTAVSVTMMCFGIILGVKVHRYQELPKSVSIFSQLTE